MDAEEHNAPESALLGAMKQPYEPKYLTPEAQDLVRELARRFVDDKSGSRQWAAARPLSSKVVAAAPPIRTSLPYKGLEARQLKEATRTADGIAAMQAQLEVMQALLAQGLNDLAKDKAQVAESGRKADRRRLLGNISLGIGIVAGLPSIAAVISWLIDRFS